MYHHKEYAYVSSSKINLMAAKNLLQVWIQSKNSDASKYRILILVYMYVSS